MELATLVSRFGKNRKKASSAVGTGVALELQGLELERMCDGLILQLDSEEAKQNAETRLLEALKLIPGQVQSLQDDSYR